MTFPSWWHPGTANIIRMGATVFIRSSEVQLARAVQALVRVVGRSVELLFLHAEHQRRLLAILGMHHLEDRASRDSVLIQRGLHLRADLHEISARSARLLHRRG